ncbi:MAG TPA: hypothetical protein VH560_02720 [Polyangia bacterium]|jgi:hypothetical protein|nr:hypothetical protein [Polyangia bacterium]
MTSHARVRVRLLCEDARHRDFALALLKCLGFNRRIVRGIHVAPAGIGSGKDWVKKQYADFIRTIRAKNCQTQLGALVLIDGDAEGTGRGSGANATGNTP